MDQAPVGRAGPPGLGAARGHLAEALGVGGRCSRPASLVPGSGLHLPAGPGTFLAEKPCRDGRRPRDVLGLISEETRINEKFLCSGALQSRLLPTLGSVLPGRPLPRGGKQLALG